jgi:hypothetical protein
MTDDQAKRLWDRASAVPAGGRIVEIGSYLGRSTILLAYAAAPDVEVVAIDPHGSTIRTHDIHAGQEEQAEQWHKSFLANLERAGVRDRVTYVRKSSHAALWDIEGDVDMLYVDGSHDFFPARNDIREWGSRVGVGGTMLIHDSFTSFGVTMAILSTLVAGDSYRYIGRAGSLTDYRREPLDRVGRRQNAMALLSQLPYFARNVVVEVMLLARLRPLTKYLGYDTSLDWPH